MAFIDRYFQRQEVSRFDVTLLHKLAFIGDRGMGAIEYLPKEHNETTLKESVINAKDAYEEMKSSMKKEDSSIEELLNIIDSVSPVGGGRPKMLVQYDYTKKKIKLNKTQLTPGFQRAIIKFDEVYDYVGSIGLTRLEYIFMSMAKEIGIDTAEFELIQENSFYHLLVKRFDRDKNDEVTFMENIRKYRSLLHDNGVILSVAGIISQEMLVMFVQNLKTKIDSLLDINPKAHNIFNIFIELVQNILNYSKSKDEDYEALNFNLVAL